ncbi:hypothetical protein PI125_g12749 [Phytophthora idaei]|nr:hypothetical protein PI125_g12749 [Phytophthora idaei]KAG3150523.1 hypothetical protein PI126_g11468 [Phytophthora idaei]
MTDSKPEMREFGRDLRRARIILIKIGTEIVHSPEGLLAMGQIGNIVEQIAMLRMRGHKIILVSSGSITIGKMVLRRQYLLSGSMQSHLGGQVGDNVEFYEKACAAAGQSGLQMLASDADFREPQVRENLKSTLGTLLDVGIIPVINENDVITRRTAPLLSGEKMAWDNSSRALSEVTNSSSCLSPEYLPWVRTIRSTHVSEQWIVELFALLWSRKPNREYFCALSPAIG